MTITRLVAGVAFSACLLLAEKPIRVDWNTGGLEFAEPPRFDKASGPGTVIVQLELAPDGSVKQAKVISGLPEFRANTLRSAKNWRFRTSAGLPRTMEVWVYFTEDNGSARPSAPMPPPPPFEQPLGALVIEGVSGELRERIEKETGLRVGAPVTEEAWNRAKRALDRIDPSLGLVMTLGYQGQLNLKVSPRRRHT